jgi:TonB family protein
MNDKPLNAPQSVPNERLDTNWVMVFNLITGKGKEEQKKTFKVNKKRVVIGSALSSDIRIQQNAVSNVHAVVEMDENGNAHVYDMASETGLFVNDHKTVSQDLKDGDEIKIGFAVLTYKKMQVSEAQSMLPPSAVRASASGHRKLFYDAKEDFRPLILEDERNVIQIFDYPSSSERALQVVMYWGDVILDVKHIVDQKAVTLGEGKSATFCVPGLHSEHPFVSFEGAAQLQFTSEMSGVVRSGKELIPLEQLSGNRFHLKENDLAKIRFRDISFFVSYSPLPPHLKRQRVMERDPLYFRIWFSSILFTVALVLLLMGIEPPKKLETEELSPRVATIIFKAEPVKPPPPEPVKPPPKPPEPVQEVKPPEPVKPPPPPMVMPPPPMEIPPPMPVAQPPKPVPIKTTPTEKPVTAVNQVKGQAAKPAGGNEGEGARAAGTEGRKGAPNKPKSPVGMYESRGNPNLNTPTKSQVQGKGNVEALFSDIGGSISKNLAAGSAGAKAAGERLKGHGAFTTEGNGGLGNLGSGSGGGGTSETVEGLGTKGFGDGAKGSGLGAIGSGGNLSGVAAGGRPNVEVGNASETIIMGGLDKSVIDEYIKRHMRQIRNCYERELSGNQKLSGRVSTQFVISGSGRVTQAGVESSSIGNASVERCLTDVLKRIVFPEPLGGGIVEVKYPFAFTPSVGGN